MRRIYFVQQLFNLSDPGMEEALCEPPALLQKSFDRGGGNQMHPEDNEA